jgi:hypothetical protein
MISKVLALTIGSIFLVSTAAAFTPSQRKRHKAKAASTLTEVKVCPMNGEVIESKNAPSEVVGNRKVYFCCAAHKEAFNKLSPEEKEKKIAAALEKQSKKG